MADDATEAENQEETAIEVAPFSIVYDAELAKNTVEIILSADNVEEMSLGITVHYNLEDGVNYPINLAQTLVFMLSNPELMEEQFTKLVMAGTTSETIQ